MKIMKTFSILTLGCRVNQSESDVIEGNLIQRSHTVVPLSRNPDYCIVNTCSVTARSDYQSRQLIRRGVRTGAHVIVTGCYAQLRPNDIKSISKDINIVNNSDKYNIINVIDNDSPSVYLHYYSNKSRPLIKVQDGCNNACAFCIVPYARGRSRSVESRIIVDQVITLETKGFNEIVLTGIHLGSYGRDLKPKLRLSGLVEMILNKTKIKRIRFSSIGINEIDSKLIELFLESRICNHLHIPLQSGDDEILRNMNRLYSTSAYLQKISEIIMKNPKIAIGTDVIVGFPGESDKAFMNTKNLIEQIPFAYLHIFPYSSRPGSAASRMTDQIEFSTKKKRLAELSLLNIRKKISYQSSQINQILEVIMEDEAADQVMIGTSSNYLKIKVDSGRHTKKSLVAVRVTEREGDTLRGVPI